MTLSEEKGALWRARSLDRRIYSCNPTGSSLLPAESEAHSTSLGPIPVSFVSFFQCVAESWKELSSGQYTPEALPDGEPGSSPSSHSSLFLPAAGEVTAIVIGAMCGCLGLAVIVRFVVKTIR